MRLVTALVSMGLALTSNLFAALDDTVELKSERLSLRLDPRYFAEVSLSYQETSMMGAVEREQFLPSIHARSKLGLRFWKGRGEFFLSVGAIKLAKSLKLIQKRPNFELDFYPLLGRYGQLAQYHVIHLPFSDSSYQEDFSEPEKQGAIYTVGIAPTLILPLRTPWFHLDWKLGGDVWTRLYSRAQKINQDQASNTDFSLLEIDDDLSEDQHATLQTLATVGFAISPLFIKNAIISLQSYIKSTHYPYYSFESQWEQSYKVRKLSYHRLRLNIGLASRLVLSGDLYYFYDGVFQGEAELGERRSRGIFKMTYHL